MTNFDLMEITKREIQHIHRSLEHGQKGECAKHLGIHQSALSRYLAFRYVRCKMTNKLQRRYSMPIKVYKGILEFIEKSK